MNRLAITRLVLGYSQEAIAETINCSRPMVSMIENGKRTLSPVAARKLSQLYGLDQKFLLSIRDENESDSLENVLTKKIILANEKLGKEAAGIIAGTGFVVGQSFYSQDGVFRFSTNTLSNEELELAIQMFDQLMNCRFQERKMSYFVA